MCYKACATYLKSNKLHAPQHVWLSRCKWQCNLQQKCKFILKVQVSFTPLSVLSSFEWDELLPKEIRTFISVGKLHCHSYLLSYMHVEAHAVCLNINIISPISYVTQVRFHVKKTLVAFSILSHSLLPLSL